MPIRSRSASAASHAPHVLLATGGMPFVPDLPGREHVIVSDAMFDLAPFPKRLLVVGGGYIACEFASIFTRPRRRGGPVCSAVRTC